MPRLFASRLFGPQTVSGGGGGAPPDEPQLVVVDSANGGEGVATITGSSGGADNVLWSQPYDPAFGLFPWRNLGNVTGDGAITFTLPLGHYAFKVVSELNDQKMVSNITYGALSDAAQQSVLWRSLLAVQVRVRALALPHLASQSVVVQEIPYTRMFDSQTTTPSRLPLPGILICPLGQESIAAATNYRDDIGYPIVIATMARNNQEVVTYLPRYTLWREKLFRAFRQGRLPGVTEVYDMGVEPGPIVGPEQFNQNIWTSAMLIRCTAREPRGLGA